MVTMVLTLNKRNLHDPLTSGPATRKTVTTFGGRQCILVTATPARVAKNHEALRNPRGRAQTSQIASGRLDWALAAGCLSATTLRAFDASCLAATVLRRRDVALAGAGGRAYDGTATDRRNRALGCGWSVAGSHGRVAEWSNAPVLKTGVGKPTGGSNPSPTVLLSRFWHERRSGDSPSWRLATSAAEPQNRFASRPSASSQAGATLGRWSVA